MNNSDFSLYRPCVGILLLNKDGKVFVGKRIDTETDAWQMPQGGIDDNEAPYEAALRELKEEIGTDHATLIYELPDWYFYDLPQDLQLKLWDGKFKGQRQKWFIFRFEGQDHDICLETEHPEFNQWRWVDPFSLPKLAIEFKRSIYAALLDELTSHMLI